MNDKVCYIFGAGDLYAASVDIPQEALVIAADGGLYHTKKLGITPDVFLGDFDSADKTEAGENCVVFPSKKDYTDMFLAVEYGRKQGYTIFEIYGGLGGRRIAHTLANIQMLVYYAKMGCTLRLHGNQTLLAVFTNDPESSGRACVKLCFDAENRGYISLFALGGKVCGLTISGLKYTLENAELTSDFPLGVSNEFTGKPASVSFACGSLLVIVPENTSVKEESV